MSIYKQYCNEIDLNIPTTLTSVMMLSIKLQMKHRRNVHLYGAMLKAKSIFFHLQI